MSASGTSEAGPVEAIPETIPEPIPQEAEDVIDKSTPEGNPTSPTPEPEPAAKKPTDTEDPPQVTIPKSHKKAANREKGEAKRKRPNVTPTSPSAEENDNANDESKDFQLRLPPGSVNDEVGDADFPEPDFVSRPSIPSEAILTSDELNFLVYRYLLESGFVHSAFVFGGESYISKTNIEDAAQLVPGALISFVQKGLQYLEIESHINDDGTETVCDEAFSVMKPHVCSSNTTKKRIFEPYEPMSADYGYLEIDDEEILFLKGHEDLVTFCAWSPSGRLLASGSADGITRVWDVQSQTIPGRCTTSTLLKVGKKSEGGGEEKAQNEGGEGKGESSSSSSSSRKRPRQAARKTETSCKSSVLALAWKDDSILASGSYDGATHIWNANGQLLHSATNHEGPVCCLQWAKRGAKTFASGGMDNAVVVCDQEGTVVAKFIHKGPVLDLDWRNDTIFATGSTDRRVRVFEVGKPEPIREFTTHRSDVNAVRWDPEGNLLASAGADCAVKVWNVLTGQCAHDFREHTREVVCLAWSSPPSSSSSTLMLASGSMDTTVKIWDVVQGKCMLTITKHTHPVTAIAFSPQGDAIATAAYERLCLWNAKDGELLRTFKHDGGINHLSWGNDYKLAVGCADHAVCVVDMTPKGNS